MLSVSPPVTYAPSAPANKRSHDHGKRTQSRPAGLFFEYDSDSNGEEEESYGPLPKKPMLERPVHLVFPGGLDFMNEPPPGHDSNELPPGRDSTEPPPGHESTPAERVSAEQLPHASGPSQVGQSQMPGVAGDRTSAPSEAEDDTAIPPYGPTDTSFRLSTLDLLDRERTSYTAKTCAGKSRTILRRRVREVVSYRSMVAARSKTKDGRATRSYYGIQIHELVHAAFRAGQEKNSAALPPAASESPAASETPPAHRDNAKHRKAHRTQLWTEKYRARSFIDLCGDDGTNRLVLRWLKRWDPVVFPGAARARPIVRRPPGQPAEEEKPHRKILMLTGPPGLGKTTLAHVCARQAGYEVLEINASDDRSRDVVQNRIRTSLGTENVKRVADTDGGDGAQPKVARPVCVVVDEVDGVVSGTGGSGEGGFIRALMDLVLLDQKNAGGPSASTTTATGRGKKKQDNFRFQRPLILICNDVYHPSLRPLRQSNLAEIVHVGKPPMDAVVGRLAAVFEKEGIPCEKDAARKLCEAAWGVGGGGPDAKQAESTMEGDLRSALVFGEWVAGRFRSAAKVPNMQLSRHWIEQNVLRGLSSAGSGLRGMGRGSARDIVGRIFRDGGGFPKQTVPSGGDGGGSGGGGCGGDSAVGDKFHAHEQPKAQLSFSDFQKRHTMERLREMVETCGEVDRVVTGIFAEYPNREFNDDCYLTKPDKAYDWLHFHDVCSSRLFGSQDWELTPYLSQSALACHHLFASPHRRVAPTGYDRRWGGGGGGSGGGGGLEAEPPAPFSGPRADYAAYESEKHNRALLQALQGQLPPTLGRAFRSPEAMAVDLLPYLVRIVAPDVKPVVVGGSQGSTASVRREGEKAMVKRAAEVMADVGMTLQKGRVESESIANRGAQYVYRMDPDLDALAMFETATTSLVASQAPARYAVRQVIDQELQRTLALRENAARQARYRGGNPHGESDDLAAAAAKKDREKKRPASRGMASGPGATVKRDFFGRIVAERPRPQDKADEPGKMRKGRSGSGQVGYRVWVTYNEGLNNAVRKPLSLQDFMRGL